MTRILLQRKVEMGEVVVVSGDELRYLARVRRHRLGDLVIVRDANGLAFEAELIELAPRRAALKITATVSDRRAAGVAPVTIVAAVPKRNLMDDIVRKLSEVGVSRLIPVIAERTAADPSAERERRWQRIAAEAMRQCGRPCPLQIDPVRSLTDALSVVVDERRLLLDPSGAEPLARVVPAVDAVTLAVGPEGGFTQSELAVADAAGFLPVTLGMPILRIETAVLAAGIVAVALRQAPGTSF